MRLLWLLVTLLICYGSLFPFNFVWQWPEDFSWLAWLLDLEKRTTRSDELANFLLFIPFGFFGVLSVQERYRRGRVFGILLVFFSGSLIAYGLQWMQHFLPSRVPASGDALINIGGLAAGCLGAAFSNSNRLRQWIPAWFSPRVSASLLIVLFWLAMQSFPFVPALDWQLVKSNLKPLLAFSLDGSSLAWHLLTWSVCFYCLRQSFDREFKVSWLLVFSILVLGYELLLRRHFLNGHDLLAVPLALLLVSTLRPRALAAVLAAGCLLAVVLTAWYPFRTDSDPNSFSFIPFAAFLKGAMWYNIQRFLEKVFLYGSLVLLLAKFLPGYRPATLAAMSLLLALELGQIFLVGHTPEITDPLLAGLLGIVLYQADRFERKAIRRRARAT